MGPKCPKILPRVRSVRKFTFSNRVIDNWNSLPELCVNSVTINSFKKHVSIALEPETV